MIAALAGGLLGLTAGALSVGSLWLITALTARAASGLSLPTLEERPTGWDAEAQDPDVVTAGQWFRIRQEAQERGQTTHLSTPSPTVPLLVRQDEPSQGGGLPNATLRVVFAFLLKAPLLVLVALVAQRLGTDALHWCVGGVVLVYSLAVFWAAARTRKG